MGSRGVSEVSDDFKEAVAFIDAEFGEGYARANPNVLVAFLNSISRYETCFDAGLLEELSVAMESLARSLSTHAEAITTGMDDEA